MTRIEFIKMTPWDKRQALLAEAALQLQLPVKVRDGVDLKSVIKFAFQGVINYETSDWDMYRALCRALCIDPTALEVEIKFKSTGSLAKFLAANVDYDAEIDYHERMMRAMVNVTCGFIGLAEFGDQDAQQKEEY
jgi:hypothetical protein